MAQSFNQTILKRDAQANVIQDTFYSDMTFRGEYDGSNNLIYKGYARPGASEGGNVWQIAKCTYDVSNNLTAIEWPQDTTGNESSEFVFNWTGRAGYVYG